MQALAHPPCSFPFWNVRPYCPAREFRAFRSSARQLLVVFCWFDIACKAQIYQAWQRSLLLSNFNHAGVSLSDNQLVSLPESFGASGEICFSNSGTHLMDDTHSRFAASQKLSGQLQLLQELNLSNNRWELESCSRLNPAMHLILTSGWFGCLIPS